MCRSAAAKKRTRSRGSASFLCQALVLQALLRDLHGEFLKGPGIDLVGFETQFMEEAARDGVAFQVGRHAGVAAFALVAGIVHAFGIVASAKLLIIHAHSPLLSICHNAPPPTLGGTPTMISAGRSVRKLQFSPPSFHAQRSGQGFTDRDEGRRRASLLPRRRRLPPARAGKAQPSFSKSATPCLQMGQIKSAGRSSPS